MTMPLAKSEIERHLAVVPDWAFEEGAGALKRQLVFRDFRDAMAFLVRLAFEAEEADHHPDFSLSYKRVNFSLSTHSAGGVTEKDFALAGKIDSLWARWT